jgi:hypothetical protein
VSSEHHADASLEPTRVISTQDVVRQHRLTGRGSSALKRRPPRSRRPFKAWPMADLIARRSMLTTMGSAEQQTAGL